MLTGTPGVAGGAGRVWCDTDMPNPTDADPSDPSDDSGAVEPRPEPVVPALVQAPGGTGLVVAAPNGAVRGGVVVVGEPVAATVAVEKLAADGYLAVAPDVFAVPAGADRPTVPGPGGSQVGRRAR